MENFDISARLKELRKFAGITQEEFAELSGLNYKFYQHLESGRKKLVRIDTIERICEGYKMELWEFFYNNNSLIKKVKLPRQVKHGSHYKKSKRPLR